MEEKELLEKMKQHEKDFNNLIDKINSDVIKFADANPQVTTYDLLSVDRFSDYMVESGGWIKDRINDTLNSEKPKKSLVRKLRKVLGYTNP